MRTLCSGGEPGHRDPRLPRRRAREPARPDAGAVPGGRLPRRRSSTATSTSAWSRRARAACSGRTVFCLYPHQTRYVVPASAVTAGAGHRARRAGRAGRDRGDRGERPVGRRTAGRRPDRRGRRRHGRLLRRRAARPLPRRPGPAGRRRSRAGGASPRPSASTSRCPRTPRATATSSSTPAPPRRGSPARWNCSPPEGTVIELSWYGDRRVSLPLGEAFHSRRLTCAAARWPVSPARRARRTFADRLALALRPARRPRVRRADHRRDAPSRNCPR